MADPDMDEDLFADLYDGEDADPVPQTAPLEPAPVKAEPYIDNAEVKIEPPPAQEVEVKTEDVAPNGSSADVMQGFQTSNGGGFKQENGAYGNGGDGHNDYNERPIGIKEDG